MNCCNTYGQCDQGRDCPARTGALLPSQARHAASLPVEFVGDEPAQPTEPLCECLPLTRSEAAFMLAGAAGGMLAWLAAIAALTGYVWGWL